jgi:pheromone shutdown-related protein TraB
LLVGTAHISRESQDLVRETIERERPDRVCIELDARRYEALSQPERFENLDLREVIRRRQLGTLLLNLVLAAYQRRLGGALGVLPGAELQEAARVAEEHGIPVSLCDRDVRVTLRRAWHATSFWRKWWLLASLLSGIFEPQELSEEDLRELRQQDVLSKLLQEMGAAFPGLKSVLIDERDRYLAHKMREAPGGKVVAVVGAGHLQGVRQALLDEGPVDVDALEQMPPPGHALRLLGWGIPLVILGSLAWIVFQQGAAAAGENLQFWILANGLPAMLGATLALAHPATVAVAFLAAPITSLTPVVGVGYVTAFVQAYYRPPLVRELRNVSHELASASAWWRNRLLRIFLVLILTTIGSLIGTWIGGAEILSNLF